MSDQLIYGPFISLQEARSQGLKEYFTGKPCKSGHISVLRVSQQTCVECKRSWAKRHYETHKNGAVQQSANKRATARDMERRRTNPEHLERRRTQIREAARRRLDAAREYSRDYYQTNIQRRLKTLLQVRVRRALLDQQAEKSQSTAAELGCTIEELARHFESRFSKGMTWENIGKWHIDHIRPCASFDLTDRVQQSQCFHYTNLQPLWAEDNLRKSDSWDGEETA